MDRYFRKVSIYLWEEILVERAERECGSLITPPYPDKRGKKGKGIDIDGKSFPFIILDEIVRPQSTNPNKLIYLQRIQFDLDGKIEYRIAYYILGKKPRMAGKWVFGQYATMMNPDDFEFIVKEARTRGWLDL